MRYLLAIVLPPVAVLICGKPVQAVLNLVLTLLLWVPGMVHALLVAHDYYEDRRSERMIRAIRAA
ncbi:MAG: YqaE/Pmp3 family membrane protein [Phycisphaerales bacterium]|nr:YqaE/Pmp3 family membrane protein [Phycisphaerales bacterium]